MNHENPVIRRLLGDKIQKILKRSDRVIVANYHLAEWMEEFHSDITIIPTSVCLSNYPVNRVIKPTNETPIIGWIGTPITSRYLRIVERSLQRLRINHDFILKVIGAPNFNMEGVDVLGVPWSESTEFHELFSCDIGIMPLPDDDWARGKSALKLIQYLASGVAGVASPVGANSDVIQDGVNGFLATNDDEWVRKLSLLIEHPSLRRRLAHNGRLSIEECYSVHANAPDWLKIVGDVAL